MEQKDVLLGGDCPEEVLGSIVAKYGSGIYLEERFFEILSSFLKNEKKLLRILSIVLEFGGGEMVLKMKSLTGASLTLEKKRVVTYLSEESLLDEKLIGQGVALLLLGLGVEVLAVENNPEDFEIVDGVLLAYHGKDEVVAVPETVREIGKNAFFCCFTVKQVMIPESVVKIRDYGFPGCSALVGVVIPDSVREIGVGAFQGCSALKEVVIPDSVREISMEAFRFCGSLERVVIPASVCEIGERAFCECVSLLTVELGNPDVRIGEDGFARCLWQS